MKTFGLAAGMFLHGSLSFSKPSAARPGKRGSAKLAGFASILERQCQDSLLPGFSHYDWDIGWSPPGLLFGWQPSPGGGATVLFTSPG